MCRGVGFPKTVLDRYVALRERKGLTQEDLARKAKVSRPSITMLETGAKGNPSLAVLRRIAKALGKPGTDLLE